MIDEHREIYGRCFQCAKVIDERILLNNHLIRCKDCYNTIVLGPVPFTEWWPDRFKTCWQLYDY